jgi:hypothetical protein
MRTLSAADAIAPAWYHTRNLMLGPRNWRLLLKMAAVAVFANLGSFNTGINGSGHHTNSAGAVLPPAVMAFVIVAGIVIFCIGLVLFYIGSRLQFVLFEVVLRRDTYIAPLWRRYGAATWHWIGLKILFFLVAILCLAPFLIPFVIHLVHTVPSGQSNAAQIIPFLFSIFGFITAIFVVVILFGCAYALLCDFGIPSMAIEATPMRETVARIVRLIRAEPGQIALYLLLRTLLGFAAIFVAEIALFLIGLISLVPLGGAGVALWLGFHQTSSAGHIVLFAGWAILAVAFVALLVVLGIMAFGYVYTFLQAYALYFLGGRYPLVGQYLEPLLPQPVYSYPPPAFPSTPEPNA